MKIVFTTMLALCETNRDKESEIWATELKSFARAA